MGLVIRLHGINCENDFTLSHCKGDNPMKILFNNYEGIIGVYDSNVTEINVTNTVFEYDTQYWFKIRDNVTQKWVIKNIFTNKSSNFHDCIICDINPNPTPTPTLTYYLAKCDYIIYADVI